MAASAPPPSLIGIGNRAGARIDALLEAEMRRWEAVDPRLASPLAALREYVARGGKRLRPAFCYWGYVGAGGDPTSSQVVDAGAALELLHAFALLHDDIMDGSLKRRGMACLHVDYADRHRRHEWHGESRRFGDGAAILIGDLAFVYADALLPKGAPPAVFEVFDELRLEVNIGQYLDLLGTATRSVTVAEARTICVYKSGKYTIERPLHLGAALAGRFDELAKSMSAYGVPLGEAFQLRDDLLGAFGDDERLGKRVGDDFREGKPTSLYAHALAAASGSDADLLKDRFGRPDLTKNEIAAIQRVLVDTGARRAVEEMIASGVTQAVHALDDMAITDSARRQLQALATFVGERDH